MDKDKREAIREALEAFLSQHNMSQNDFAKNADVNVSYISAIRSEKHESIADKWFIRIAAYIGYKIEKSYWETKPTDQMIRILATLEEARKFGSTNVIIGETGSGKSYVSSLFQKQNPNDVFIIKLGKSDNVGDVLDKTFDALNIPLKSNMGMIASGTGQSRSKSLRIRKIIKYLQKLKHDGFNPTVIWDESEYMNLAALCAIKEFFDDLSSVAALILIGTDQLEDNLKKMSDSNKPGMPQFYSRIKFGIRRLKPINRKFPLFLNSIEDKEVKDFIKTNCNNYREVHDVLVPAMREADLTNMPLSVGLISNVLGLGGY